MHARGDVRSFLQSAAHFWLEKYHFDGLRMDAVRNLIYWNGEPARGENQGGAPVPPGDEPGAEGALPSCPSDG